VTNAFQKLFEHNDWANLAVLASCASLTGEQLDSTPLSDSPWSLRKALTHLVQSQRGYVSLLTLPPEARSTDPLPFDELREVAEASGAALAELARDEASLARRDRLRTTDGYLVEPWVVMVQAINHATQHRRQVCGMLRALGITPPRLDGWAFGESVGALARSTSST
jgi:uncharacterized damage-inducible protein DinB